MKKLIAILISVVMLFSLTATPALAGLDRSIFSARSVSTLEETTADSDSNGVLGQHKDEVNLFIKLFDELYESFHNFIHFFAGVFGSDCPMCDGEDNETPDDSTTDEPTTDEPTTEKPVEKYGIESLRNDIINSNGATVVLKEDIKVTSDELVSAAYYKETGKCMLSIDSNVTIDLNGHTLSYVRENKSDEICAFGLYIKDKANVNICDSSEEKTGKISVDNKENQGFLIFAIAHNSAEGVNVNLLGGNYETSNEVCVYSQTENAKISIFDGSYATTYSNSKNLLNTKDGEGKITVYGGSFDGFNVGVDNASEIVLADGFASKEEEVDGKKIYTVIEDPYKDYNKADTTETLKESLKTGGDVVAKNDIVLAGEHKGTSPMSTIGKQVLFDANGKTITNSTVGTSGYNVLFVVSSSETSQGDLTITGNGTYCLGEEAKAKRSTNAMVYAVNNGKVTIENGTFDARGNESSSNMAVFAAGNSEIVIEGGNFYNNSNSDLIYVSGAASVVIKGGFFKSTGSIAPSHTLNIRSGATGTITLYGGTFVNYNPAEPEDQGIKIAEGYKVVSEAQENGEIWYTVVAK